VLLGGALVPALCFFNVLNDAAALLLAHGGVRSPRSIRRCVQHCSARCSS
jgi:hypothetical protein